MRESRGEERWFESAALGLSVRSTLVTVFSPATGSSNRHHQIRSKHEQVSGVIGKESVSRCWAILFTFLLHWFLMSLSQNRATIEPSVAVTVRSIGTEKRRQFIKPIWELHRKTSCTPWSFIISYVIPTCLEVASGGVLHLTPSYSTCLPVASVSKPK